MPVTTEARSARLDEFGAAFRLLFGTLAPEVRDQRCLLGLYLIARGELDPHGLLVVPTGDGLGGAMLCQRLPGAAGVVWPPGVPPGPDRSQTEDVLCRESLTWLRQGGAKLAQGLLSDEEIPLAGPLVRHGFERITDLWELRHDLAEVPPAPELTCRTWDKVDRTVFQDTLLLTYEGSRDFPELTGSRTTAEIIAGHQGGGVFDPESWWLAFDGNRPVGVLLLTEMPDGRNWDVSYVGVVPAARRRGLGRALMQKALAEARAAGAPALTLSVDERNAPARQLYRSLGFQPLERRVAYLRLHP
jgi:ribosomal protein S18 acetylase RimI-like enzyme